MINGSLLDYLKDGDGKNSKLPDQIDMSAQVGFDIISLMVGYAIWCSLIVMSILDKVDKNYTVGQSL